MPLKSASSYSCGRQPIYCAVVVLGGLVAAFAIQTPRPDRQLVQGGVPKSEYRIALVIGNGAYENASHLKNAANDATDVANTLQELGFKLIGGDAHLNQTADQMKRLISQFGEKLSGADVGLFYYAGHGVQSQAHNYLIPVEANILREKTLEYEAVDVNRVLAEMDAAANGLNIVILDACRNNPFSRSWRDSSQGLAQINAPEGTLIAYSTSPGKVAGDGSGRNGTYTGQLLKQMREPNLPIEEMFKAVRIGVKTETRNQQTPWESSSIVGQFCFGGCGPRESGISRVRKETSGQNLDPDVTRVDTSAVDLSFWESIKNSDDPEDFRDYLKRFPNGQFADLARRRSQPHQEPANKDSQTPASPTFFTLRVRVRADNANNGWTNSGLVVRAGQHLHITASGRVSIGRNRFSTPEGVSSIPDFGKLMPNAATGALIAVIGDNNDDFILIGPRREFVAQRDGVLFLGVNEGDLADNTGSYDIVIEAEAGGGTPR